MLITKLAKSPSATDMRLKKNSVPLGFSLTIVPKVCSVLKPQNWFSHKPISVMVSAVSAPAFHVAV